MRSLETRAILVAMWGQSLIQVSLRNMEKEEVEKAHTDNTLGFC